MTAADYLARPYARRLTPDEAGGYVATIQEFPGLIAEGDTADDALTSLDEAAKAWIETSLATGREIPEPIDFDGCSGKIALRIPRGLHKRAAEMAVSEGISLNLWLTGAISHYLGAKDGLQAMARQTVVTIQSFNLTANISVMTDVRFSKESLSNSDFGLSPRIRSGSFYYSPTVNLQSGAIGFSGDSDV
jgi:predicted RNase H-like HicB family nuclease